MNGLVTLITGGAAGLGLGCVKRFARQGARVIICDLPSSKGNEVVDKWSLTFASSSNSALNEPEENTTVYFLQDNFISFNRSVLVSIK
jgi:3-hydroxyacyl-CoA dehydrogenase/3-hydroxy-2-methylbutyryl-CoA dehydrogenase